MGASEKNKRNFLEGQQGHSHSENYIMHKVETAGHAGTESCPLSRLPVLKLLTWRAAIGGAQELQLGGGPRSQGGEQATRAPSTRQGGGANVENERRLKADGAQDCSVYAFFGSSCLSTETGCRWLGEAL